MKYRALAFFAVGLLLACGGVLWALLALKPRMAPPPPWSLPSLPVEQVKAPVPPRFFAPLPAQVENFQEELEKGPPLAHVQLRLLEGDREIGERFLSALRQAAPRAGTFKALQVTYGEALWPERMGMSEDGFRYAGDTEGDLPCDWLREHLGEPGGEHPLIRELFWSKLALCPGPEVEALFARDEAPLPLVIEHYRRHSLPRLTEAMRKGVRRLVASDRQDLFVRAAAFLARSTDPGARPLLEELAQKARGEFTEEIHERRTAHQRSSEYHERQCRFLPTTPAVLDELKLNMCLELWAQTDWQATARLASLLVYHPSLAGFHDEQLATLTRFASAAGRDDWAREQGLLPDPLSPMRFRLTTLSLRARMVGAKRAHAFFPRRMEPGSFPARHDELLVNLAWMARPELQGVVFEELPPPWDEDRVEAVGDYTLRAYADGERFSLTARNLGDWWDVGAVLVLLNQVLAARGSTTRFAASDHRSPTMVVVFGPESALREAHAAGLLRLGDASEVLSQVRAAALKSQRRMLGLSP